MSFSFLFMAPVFANRNRLETAVRWIFVIAFILSFVSLAVIPLLYELDRQDRFEIEVLSIDWLVLIINGVLLSIVFRRQLKVMPQNLLPVNSLRLSPLACGNRYIKT